MDDANTLETLRTLALDQIGNTDVFDRITLLATTLMACPISIISVVDEKRKTVLGSTGLQLRRLPRSASFSAVCIASGSPLIVEDAISDPRFVQNPLVTGPPHVRSYLGVPIRAENGAVEGSLCVMSPDPGAFDEHDMAPLSTLATMVEQTLAGHLRSLELKRAVSSLRELNLVFKQAESAANIGSWRVDLVRNTLYWSDQVYAIHGLPRDALIDVDNAINFYEPEDRQIVRDALADTLETGNAFNFEAKIRRTDGELRWIRSIGERIDEDGKATALAGVFLDCTEERLKTIALKHAAERDRLTGLYNRAVFDARLAEAMASSRGQAISAMLLDLDGFKIINDTMGHLIGDRLLVDLAQRLGQVAGEDIFVARWGGDEFAFLFPAGTAVETVEEFARCVIAEISHRLPCGDGMAEIGGTCGIAQMTAPASSEELVRRADVALYHGKTTGRGRVHCWNRAIEGTKSAQLRAVTQLCTALDNDMTLAAYQPIVNLRTGAVEGAEALLRLIDVQGAIIPAAEVFPALLDANVSRRVLRFMIDRVFSECEEFLRQHGDHSRITINVSESDLRPGGNALGLLEIVRAAVERHGVDPSNFAFEITETMLLLDESGDIRATLKSLEAMGFAIALDDFGTGFSSLTHLRDFPIQLVKIDQDFVAQIPTTHQSRLIIRAIVQMANSLGLKTVAEGVETAEQVEYLLSVGCHYAQGYLFGKPAPLEIGAGGFPRLDACLTPSQRRPDPKQRSARPDQTIAAPAGERSLVQ